MATYAHELSHNLSIPDNYNNPFGTVQQRAATGIWDMLSRGSFNGPGGTHTRWLIPPTQGGSLGAQHNVRNKRKLNFISDNELVRLNRDGLAQSGVAVAEVTAREVAPGANAGGVQVTLDGAGDKATPCDPNTNPLCDGVRLAANGSVTGKYNHYTIEAVQRIGADSFTPAQGVLISKTKDNGSSCGTFSCFVWVIDANPQDINRLDFMKPDGTPQMVTIADPRQLNDAPFNAGTNSGPSTSTSTTTTACTSTSSTSARTATAWCTTRSRCARWTARARRRAACGSRRRCRAPTPASPPARFGLTNTGAAAATPNVHPADVSRFLKATSTACA